VLLNNVVILYLCQYLRYSTSFNCSVVFQYTIPRFPYFADCAMTEPAHSTVSPDNVSFGTRVLSALKQDILSGYFEPGEKLKMARLKERYQIGVSPLREALSQLVEQQLVVVENQRGFTVHPISASEMNDIYHTRAEIEVLCLNRAIELGDESWEAGILAADHKVKRSAHLLNKASPEDIQRWEAIHQDFHTAIATGCASPTLMHVRRALYEKASRYRNVWLRENMLDEVVFDANQKEHQALIDALMARDSEAAAQLIRQHLLEPYRALKDTAL